MIFEKNSISYCGEDILKYDQRKPFMDQLVELSWKLKKIRIYGFQILIAIV